MDRLGPRLLAIVLASSAGLSGTVAALEPTLELDAELVSAYVFRGTVLNPDPCLQPAATLSLGALSFAAWTSVNLTDGFGQAGEIGELDLSLSAAGFLGVAEYSVGLNHYAYWTPEEGHTSELFAELVVPWRLELRVGLAWDIDAADDLYAKFAIGLPVALSDRATLDLEAATAWAGAGMNDFNFGVARGSLADGRLAAALELELAGLTVWARLEAVRLWHDDLRRAAAALYDDDSPVAGGVGLSVSLPATVP